MLFFTIFYAFVCSANDKSNSVDDNKVVANIDSNYSVTLKDLRQYVYDWKYNTRFHNKSDSYKNALNDLIKYRLRIFDFFDRRLNENQELMRKIRRNINNELMNAFFDKSFVEKYTNEKTAAEVYQEMDKEIICIDLILLTPAQPTKEKLDSLKAIAAAIEIGLSKNYNISSFSKSYSLKNFKINSNRKVIWSETMTDPVADVIFRLHKGFTRIIESADGFHIVKVLSINKIKLKPFKEMKDDIVAQLEKGFYDTYNNAYDNFRHGLVDKNSVKWNQSGLDQITKWSAEDENFYGGAYKDTIQKTISNGHNFEILCRIMVRSI